MSHRIAQNNEKLIFSTGGVSLFDHIAIFHDHCCLLVYVQNLNVQDYIFDFESLSMTQ